MSKSLSSTDNAEQLLNEYKHAIFDNLTDPEEAYDYVTSMKGEETINSSIRDLFVRHGMCDKFGITLLHRHFDMDPSERLVSVGNTSVPWGPSDYNNKSLGSAIPQSFIFSQDKIVPFEYTFFTNEAIGNATGIDAATKAFLIELRDLLFSLKLEKVLGLRVFSGQVEEYYTNVEFTIGRANIFVEVENPPKNQIPTSWYFNAQREATCVTVCLIGPPPHVKRHKNPTDSLSPNLIECVA